MLLIGGDLLLIICRIQVTKLIERFGGLLSGLHWYEGSCIAELRMICS
jgi:hypothetical protein